LKVKRPRKPEPETLEINHLSRIQKFFKGEERAIQKAVDASNAGKTVKEEHTELVKRMQQTMHDYMVEMGLSSPEVEVEEPDLDAIMEENRRLKEQLAGKQPAPAKPEGHKRTIRKAA
jgi:ATP phosphoribosyltransferase